MLGDTGSDGVRAPLQRPRLKHAERLGERLTAYSLAVLTVEPAREQRTEGTRRQPVHLVMVVDRDATERRRLRIRRVEELEVGRQLKQQRRLRCLRTARRDAGRPTGRRG